MSSTRFDVYGRSISRSRLAKQMTSPLGDRVSRSAQFAGDAVLGVASSGAHGRRFARGSGTAGSGCGGSSRQIVVGTLDSQGIRNRSPEVSPMPRPDAGDCTDRGCSRDSSNPGTPGPLGATASGPIRTLAACEATGHRCAHADAKHVDLPSGTRHRLTCTAKRPLDMRTPGPNSGSSHLRWPADLGLPAGLILLSLYRAGGHAIAIGLDVTRRNFPGITTRHSASTKKKSPNIVAPSTPSL